MSHSASPTRNIIPPILLSVYPERTKAHWGGGPYEEWINRGLGADGAARFTTPYGDDNHRWWNGLAYAGLNLFGLAMLAGAVALIRGLAAGGGTQGLLDVVIDGDPRFEAIVTAGVASMTGAFLCLTVAGIISSPLRPAARAWTKALRQSWADNGHLLTPLASVPEDCRDDLRRTLRRLEAVRRGLAAGGLQPGVSDLDAARRAVVNFLQVCHLPKDGARMAAAGHLKDPAVRRAAAEYTAALKARDKAMARVIEETEAAESLLTRRRQDRDDQQLIKLANQQP